MGARDEPQFRRVASTESEADCLPLLALASDGIIRVGEFVRCILCLGFWLLLLLLLRLLLLFLFLLLLSLAVNVNQMVRWRDGK